MVKEVNFEDAVCNLLSKEGYKQVKRDLTDLDFSFLEKINPKMDTNFRKSIQSELKDSGTLEILQKSYVLNSKTMDNIVTFNNDDLSENEFTFARQVVLYDNSNETADIVIFVNGFPLWIIELKSIFNGQNFNHGISQFKKRRKTQLMKKGVIPFQIAADQKKIAIGFQNLDMFSPYNFNGITDTIEALKIILSKESVFNQIRYYVSGSASIVFPRTHQLVLLNKLSSFKWDSKRILINHSMGSGKTYSIVTSAYMLANEKFDKIVILTDRKEVIQNIFKVALSKGTPASFFEDFTGARSSSRIPEAFENKSKIIISTIQKFAKAKFKKDYGNVCILIDESHSSTAGDQLAKIVQTFDDSSYMGFTGTPKNSTFDIFSDGFKTFDSYTMKDAINDGYILDVSENIVSFNLFAKETDSISKIASSDKGVQVISESIFIWHETKKDVYFDGKSMVVTPSIKSAIKFYDYFKKASKKVLVSFSGESTVGNEVLTEASINGANIFDAGKSFKSGKYDYLIVCDKHLTGYDYPKLKNMFICREMKDIKLIQAISRLNRIAENKTETLIVDYGGNERNITKALNDFGDLKTNIFNDNKNDSIEDTLSKIHELIRNYINGFEYELFDFNLDILEQLESWKDNFSLSTQAFKIQEYLNALILKRLTSDDFDLYERNNHFGEYKEARILLTSYSDNIKDYETVDPELKAVVLEEFKTKVRNKVIDSKEPKSSDILIASKKPILPVGTVIGEALYNKQLEIVDNCKQFGEQDIHDIMSKLKIEALKVIREAYNKNQNEEKPSQDIMANIREAWANSLSYIVWSKLSSDEK